MHSMYIWWWKELIYKKCNIINFGKFNHRELEFSDGLNLIYGDNESGKSTLYFFLRSMIFGMRRGRGRASKTDLYSRYKPWDLPQIYAGELEFRSGAKDFRISRDFSDATEELVCLTDGERMSVADGDLDMLCGSIGEAVYDNSMSIGQLSAANEEKLKTLLKNYMAGQLAEGGLYGDGFSVDNAAQMPMHDFETVKSNLRARKKEIENTIRCEQKEAGTRIEEARLKLQTTEENQQRLSLELQQLERELRQAESRLRQAEKAQRQDEKVPLQEEKTERMATGIVFETELPPVFPAAGAFAWIICLLCIFAMQFLPKLKMLLGIITLIALVAGMALTGSYIRGQRRWLLKERSREKVANDPVNEVQVNDKRKAENPSKAENAAEGMRHREEKNPGFASAQETEPGKAETEKSNLTEEESRVEKLRWNISFAGQELRKTELQMENERAEYEELLGNAQISRDAQQKLAAVKLAMHMMEEIAGKMQQANSGKLLARASEILRQITGGRYVALRVAEDMTIGLLQRRQRADADRRVSEGTFPARFDRRDFGDKYADGMYAGDMHAGDMHAGDMYADDMYAGDMDTDDRYDDRPVSLASVSQATREQACFALRMAAAELLCEEEFPIILDETFAMWDEKRLANVLQWLASGERQILLFSCRSREKACLDRMNLRYRYLEL